jgi:phosphate transport system substrate-binding protein
MPRSSFERPKGASVSRKAARLLAVVAAVSLMAAVPAAAQAKKIITISGSTSVFPLETQLARAWIKTKKGKGVGFKILQGGSNVGVDDVAHGRVTIGASSRDPASTDPGGLVFTRIARDAICMIVNQSNTLQNITQAQIQNIFLNKPGGQTWDQIPGSGLGTDPIQPKGRAPTSGTHDAFRNIFLGGTNQASPPVAALASNGLVQQAVQSSKDAIGYVSLAFTQGVNALAYNNVSCDLRNAKSFQYQGVRSFYFVTRGNPVGKAKQFISWVLGNPRANAIIGTDWVPLH